jgi:hypothetical protein
MLPAKANSDKYAELIEKPGAGGTRVKSAYDHRAPDKEATSGAQTRGREPHPEGHRLKRRLENGESLVLFSQKEMNRGQSGRIAIQRHQLRWS